MCKTSGPISVTLSWLWQALVLCAVTGSSLTSLRAESTSWYAYVSHLNGAISQYRIGSDGKLEPLAPAVVRVGKHNTSIRFHSDHRIIYVVDGEGNTISVLKIGTAGALSQLQSISTGPNDSPCNIAVDSTGRFAYVVFNGTNAQIGRYAIGDDGVLSQLYPFTVVCRSASGTLAAHPTKPYLYVSIFDDGAVRQYKIGPSGSLTPLKPASVEVGSSSGSTTIAPSGRYLFVADIRSQALNMLKVSDEGTLEMQGYATYGIEDDMCCGPATIAVDSAETTAVFTNNLAKSVYQFDLDSAGMIADERRHFYKIGLDYRLQSRDDAWELAKSRVPSLGEKAQPIDIVNAQLSSLRKLTLSPYRPAFGPDRVVYVATSGGVTRFRLVEPGTVKNSFDGAAPALEPALIWDPVSADDNSPVTGLVIVKP
jgi:hypothetical protein